MQRNCTVKKEAVKRTNPPFENTKPTMLGRRETIEDYTQDNLSLPAQSSTKTPFPPAARTFMPQREHCRGKQSQ